MEKAERDARAFKAIYERHVISRKGASELLEWLKSTDFFTAPAGAKHHGAYRGGLVHHSLNVYYQLLGDLSIRGMERENETTAICGLLHDVCKVNFYEPKDGGGYQAKNAFPFGHGEKSVYLISRFMLLTDAEALAIRWHMGAWDDAVRGGSRDLNAAMDLSPLVYALHAADMRATQEEKRQEARLAD